MVSPEIYRVSRLRSRTDNSSLSILDRAEDASRSSERSARVDPIPLLNPIESVPPTHRTSHVRSVVVPGGPTRGSSRGRRRPRVRRRARRPPPLKPPAICETAPPPEPRWQLTAISLPESHRRLTRPAGLSLAPGDPRASRPLPPGAWNTVGTQTEKRKKRSKPKPDQPELPSIEIPELPLDRALPTPGKTDGNNNQEVYSDEDLLGRALTAKQAATLKRLF